MPLYQYKDISAERTFYFVHIPKAGGAAINSYFKKVGLKAFFEHDYFKPAEAYLRVIPSHYDYETADRLFRLDRMYSFAVVRNPVRRLVSEYKFRVQRFNLPPEIKQLPFKEFLKFAVAKLDKDPDFWKGHFRPQHHFVGPKIKKIYRYEDGLDNVVRHVFADNGLKIDGTIDVPTVNKTKSQPVEIDDETIGFIARNYGEDFKRFGYPIEQPVDL